PERSVAATKSFVSSVVAGLALLAHWAADDKLMAALATLPLALRDAIGCDWSPLLEALDGHNSLYVLGRGPSLAIAEEAALKFKETCGIHAEAYSAAEVMHGPVRIVEPGYPLLVLAARDAAEPSVAGMADKLAAQGALTFAASALCRFRPPAHRRAGVDRLLLRLHRSPVAPPRLRSRPPAPSQQGHRNAMSRPVAYSGLPIFDGERWHEEAALLVDGDSVTAIVPAAQAADAEPVRLFGGFLAPGFVDLQVNGGGGTQFNDVLTVDGLRTICASHARFGTTALLPTLITDTPEITARAVEAGIAAAESHLPGFLGLHLEGPHLSLAR